MNNIEKKKTIRNLIIFILVVLLSGWFGVLVDSVLAEQSQGDSLGMGIWLVAPLIASLLLRALGGDGWRDAGFLPGIKRNIRWYIISFLIYPAVTFAVIGIGDISGWIDVSSFDLRAFSGVFAGGLLFQFIRNFFEESVWRGYLTSKLLQLGVSDAWLYVIVGSVWGLWHLAYYIKYLPLSDIQSVLGVDRLTFALISIVTMIFWTVMYTEIYRMTRSIWPLVVMHMVEDCLVNPLVLDGYINIMPGREIWVSPIVGMITSLLYLAVGLLLRSYRVRQQSYQISR